MAPLSAKETQRRYRARRDADPVKREEYLNKEKDKWRRDREEGRKKKVVDLSRRELREQRKKWKERKRNQRERVRTKALPQGHIIPQNQGHQSENE